MFPTASDLKDADGNLLITAYAVLRPNRDWSLMLVNRDQTNLHQVRVVFEDASPRRSAGFSGKVRQVSFGSEQYVWINDGPNSHPDPDSRPVGTETTASPQTIFTLPKASITVLRGKTPSF